MELKEKIDLYASYIDKIHTKKIRDLLKFILPKIPEYFWTLPTSTSGNTHGAELGYQSLLIEHVCACADIALKVANDQMSEIWGQLEKDQLLAALLLHDCWRCGRVGSELRFTQEIIDKGKYPQEKLGELKTSRNHPEDGAEELLLLIYEFNDEVPSSDKLKPYEYGPIVDAVRFHYGPWLKTSEGRFNFMLPYKSVVVQCHNIDYMSTLHNK